MFAYCYNNPVNFYDPSGRTRAGVLSAFAGWMGASAVDGPLPFGDIIGLLIIGSYLYGFTAKIDDALDKSRSSSNGVSEGTAEEPPQSITETEDETSTDSLMTIQ